MLQIILLYIDRIAYNGRVGYLYFVVCSIVFCNRVKSVKIFFVLGTHQSISVTLATNLPLYILNLVTTSVLKFRWSVSKLFLYI